MSPSRRHLLQALLIAATGWVLAGPALGENNAFQVPVQGQVMSRSHGPVPGVTAFLVHPALGRSAPSYTDVYGNFGWTSIPVRREAYYLEIYWASRLIYRSQVRVAGPLQLPPLYL